MSATAELHVACLGQESTRQDKISSVLLASLVPLHGWIGRTMPATQGLCCLDKSDHTLIRYELKIVIDGVSVFSGEVKSGEHRTHGAEPILGAECTGYIVLIVD